MKLYKVENEFTGESDIVQAYSEEDIACFGKWTIITFLRDLT